MNKLIFACGFMFVAGVLAVDDTAISGVAVPVAPVAYVAESIKLASKDWKNYKGCDDTCLAVRLLTLNIAELLR